MIEADSRGTGNHTRTIHSAGNEAFDYKPTTVEAIQKPLGQGSRTDSIALEKTGNWDLTDTIEGDFEEGGSYTITYSPTGFRKSKTQLNTSGGHNYQFNDTDDEGYQLHSHQGGNYNSAMITNHDITRSGQIVANYASDGVLVAASGSVSDTAVVNGNSGASDHAWVNKTKSRSVNINDSDTSGSGGGQAGDPGGGTSGPEVTHTDEVYTANRDYKMASSEMYVGTVTTTYDAAVGTEGNWSITPRTAGPEVDVKAMGSHSVTNSTFIRYDETDHFTSGEPITTTSYIDPDTPVAPVTDSYDDGIPDTQSATQACCQFTR